MTKYDDRRANAFLVIWTLAVIGTTAAYSFYLGVRVETIEHGYALGQAYGEVARLREVERVLELEQAAHNTPERIDLIARTLFVMDEPGKERVFSAGQDPEVESAREADAVAEGGPP